MLLTLTLTRPPATDLGYLLHKHPERVQQFSLPFGAAHVFYPEVTEERCTAALLLEARLAVLPVAGGEEIARRLFEPLGYALDAVQHPLDEKFPEWGASRYHTVHLRREVRLRD